MNIYQLNTPGFIVDLDVLEQNITAMASICRDNGKELWPMVKTHKSTDIALMQQEAGATGFLVGTLDEAERLVSKHCKNIMAAYPIVSRENIDRVLELSQKANIIVSFDGVEAASQFEALLQGSGKFLEYLIIIDCGLHRLGVLPDKAAQLAQELQNMRYLRLKGIATHPGQVYAATGIDGIQRVAAEEIAALRSASNSMIKNGFKVDVVATGSTPTVNYAAGEDSITVLRPGNYVFNDNIQISLGVATEEMCALSILATIIARPRPDCFIIDAGSKCLGLDKGAHGNALIQGYGLVKGHPELLIVGLSEEVGKINIIGETSLRIGDKILIIPNHACSAANMTSYLIGHRKGTVERILNVDARGGTFLHAEL